ncbi:hypothetical protein Pmar_PMAR003635 [Perkinsus marinus ATCC 50983]|uniref:Uncharacterized protein n=1 Tax=Perkinsus marinus (strain ATCC 50983 / TXsc) TaxID=423536 RepID=C5KHW0_PERM5|nr:hypothetical protein Pmar_PMAR003635 [Perkinsus marinus ATCC 50983]EER16172.1 hypothetical protein Pmar_PMAR003635 [Perkinsus marinus ATCC 50983]|eukprot:XP_002784376.1 hypothetical protein Pmar_PMAR003635 [Perkinsus marinus ATCC 50983]
MNPLLLISWIVSIPSGWFLPPRWITTRYCYSGDNHIILVVRSVISVSLVLLVTDCVPTVTLCVTLCVFSLVSALDPFLLLGYISLVPTESIRRCRDRVGVSVRRNLKSNQVIS